jgi:hypothetical protein
VPLRVLLDTSAIRGIVYADTEYGDFDGFDPKEAGLSICLANNAVPELALVLFEGRITWDRWSERVGVVTALLDPESPLFPSDANRSSCSLLHDGGLHFLAASTASRSGASCPRRVGALTLRQDLLSRALMAFSTELRVRWSLPQGCRRSIAVDGES